jgi:hypothetical protein
MLSAVALIAVGCTKVETDNTPDPASDAQPDGPAPAEPAIDPGPAFPEQPAEPGTAQGPAEGEGDGNREQGVAGAIGRALLKGIGGGSDSQQDRPGEAPGFNR